MLDRTLRRKKHYALHVLKDSIKTKMMSQVAKMIVVLDRTLLLIKRHAPIASREHIKT